MESEKHAENSAKTFGLVLKLFFNNNCAVHGRRYLGTSKSKFTTFSNISFYLVSPPPFCSHIIIYFVRLNPVVVMNTENR